MSNTEDEGLSRVGWLKALLMALEDVSRGHEALYDEVNGLASGLDLGGKRYSRRATDEEIEAARRLIPRFERPRKNSPEHSQPHGYESRSLKC
jgi:hypothetical protein